MRRTSTSGLTLIEILLCFALGGVILAGLARTLFGLRDSSARSEADFDLAGVAMDLHNLGRDADSVSLTKAAGTTSLTFTLSHPGAPSQVSYVHTANGLTVSSVMPGGTSIPQETYPEIVEFLACLGSDTSCALGPADLGAAAANTVFLAVPDRYLRFRLTTQARGSDAPRFQVQSGLYVRNPSPLPFASYRKGARK